MIKFIKSLLSREVLGSKSVTLSFVALVIAIVITVVGYLIFGLTGAGAGSDGSHLDVGTIQIPFRILIFIVFLL